MDYLILTGALVMIIVAATLLTDGSVALAKRLHIPEFIVGLTVMAVGTSMPELTVSMLAALGGHGDMAIGNIVGSNIFNVFAILGICAIFVPIMFTKKNVRRDIPMCIAATVALLVVTLTGGTISRLEGVLLLAGYVAMIWWTIRADKKEQQLNPQAAEEEGSIPTMPLWRIPVWIVLGLAGLIYGGDLFVTSATNIAKALGVSEAVIAITLLAGGTSLPELAASLVSIFKGSASLALGNVLGSNIANILLILGACSTVTPLTMGGVTMFDIYVAVAAAAFIMLTAFVIGRDKLTRVEGILFVACYAAYIYHLL
ncbi:MAG: calcium/sodium antiporter [Alistipes sp.]|nr:calcium/sodium antiporter [Alistipes sp.]